jgi:hypothetical protein
VACCLVGYETGIRKPKGDHRPREVDYVRWLRNHSVYAAYMQLDAVLPFLCHKCMQVLLWTTHMHQVLHTLTVTV